MAKSKKKNDKKEMPLWTDTKEIVLELYKETNGGYFDSEPVMRNSIRRVALNLLSNVSQFVDAYGYDSKIYFLNRAESNAQALKSYNTLGNSLGAIKSKKSSSYSDGLTDIKSQIGKLIVTFKKKTKDG